MEKKIVKNEKRLTFGPVPSRRLGRSLGINNIPPKNCTYACVYCQLGKFHRMQRDRTTFYSPQEIVHAVKKTITETRNRQEIIDYLAFVPDGEPSLDINIGREIANCNGFGVKIAVITNASLLWRKDVRRELGKSDYVSLKIDTVHKETWHRINRPQKSLDLDEILQGITTFSKEFSGKLVTETMLIQTMNDTPEELNDIAGFIKGLNPDISYLAIPIRPPAETWVHPADEKSITMAYQIFKKKSLDVQYLIGYEGTDFASTGNPKEDILAITSVHPMRRDAIMEVLKKAHKNWEVMNQLLIEEKIIEIDYDGKTFYMRKLPTEKK